MPAKSTTQSKVTDDKKVAKKPVAKKETKKEEVPVKEEEVVKKEVVKTPKETKQDQVVVNTQVVAETKPTDVSQGEAIINGLMEKVVLLTNNVKIIQSSLKLLAKEFDKQRKIIDKVQKKKEKAKKSPSGFAKPCKISDELCEFIGVPLGSEQSRTDITRFINSYVKEHNLNNPQNRREIFPDAKLKKILNVSDNDKVSYFVLQRLISHHFPPSQNKMQAKA